MRKVLVTGAGGFLGELVIKQLLKMEDVEIVALDLRTKKYHKKMKKFRKNIKIVYGDVNDYNLISDLVKDCDFIMHFAGIMPPLANLKESLLQDIDYHGTENIVKAISYYNPDCMLIYPSSTSVYKENDNNEYDVLSDVISKSEDYYSVYKLKIEKLIAKKLKNYVIYRLPLLLCVDGEFIYNVNMNKNVEVITDLNAASCFVKTIDNVKKVNKQVFNISEGESSRYKFSNLVIKILNNYGISLRYLYNVFFLDKGFNYGYYSDSSKLEKKIQYRSDNVNNYFQRLKRKSKRRIVQRLIAKPISLFIRVRYGKN